ncbi:Hsp20/alpha crystallin family protein [Chitinophaga qingshengii]|uniref:Hsp20/alpha crystallin family protein n=1 Tax=Chitinophaga qingshengii TaxID=1569794 RepID=A0ABR7TQE5_9BACT|nr:Hsp20/alpha crystallin family protein [Chitinophaga qingshengii]MBC9932687.1 Hsp20/alpha crystallin family protein [Chitinophaga qingshengii]
MSLVRSYREPLTNLPTLFENLLNRGVLSWGNANNSSSGTTIPTLNIRETDEDFLVELAAPGMKKEDFKIHLDGNNLCISSERNINEEEPGNGKYSYKEFSYQSFKRTVTLPSNVVDEEKIQARYDSGILSLKIPKKEEVKKKAPRLIAIN